MVKNFPKTIYFVEVCLSRVNVNWTRLMAICTVICLDLKGSFNQTKVYQEEFKLVFEQEARIEEEAHFKVRKKVNDYLSKNSCFRDLKIKSVNKY